MKMDFYLLKEMNIGIKYHPYIIGVYIIMFFACTLLHHELQDYSLGQVAFAVFQALLAITQLLCHVSALPVTLTSACKQA